MFLVNISELGRALVTVDLYPARDFCFKIAGLVRLITYSANHRLRSIGREILPKYQQNLYTKTKQEEEVHRNHNYQIIICFSSKILIFYMFLLFPVSRNWI